MCYRELSQCLTLVTRPFKSNEMLAVDSRRPMKTGSKW